VTVLTVILFSSTLLQSKLESSSQLTAELQRHQTDQIKRQQEQLGQQQQKIQELQVCKTSI
jgi:hypothetical protein